MSETALIVLCIGATAVVVVLAYLLYAVHRITKALAPRKRVVEPAPKMDLPAYDDFKYPPLVPPPVELGQGAFSRPKMRV